MTTILDDEKYKIRSKKCEECEIPSKIVRKTQLRLIFKNIYGREPTSEELQTFEDYLRLIGAWK